MSYPLIYRPPLSEIELSYVRSSGPGGQNVNKVNSKAVLRWNLRASPSIPEGLRIRLLERLASRLTGEGEIVITSDRYRDQGRNREDCLTKLTELIIAAAHVPKSRKETKPTYSSKRRKLDEKSGQARKKQLRGRVRSDD